MKLPSNKNSYILQQAAKLIEKLQSREPDEEKFSGIVIDMMANKAEVLATAIHSYNTLLASAEHQASVIDVLEIEVEKLREYLANGAAGLIGGSETDHDEPSERRDYGPDSQQQCFDPDEGAPETPVSYIRAADREDSYDVFNLRENHNSLEMEWLELIALPLSKTG